MPLYEYECGACGHRFELIQRFSDPPVERCPSCAAGPVHKLLSAPAIQFKGSGWYITDYGGKKGDSAVASAPKEDGKSEGKPDAASAPAASSAASSSSPAPPASSGTGPGPKSGSGSGS